MTYHPQEGVDYIIDYYALIDADPSADPDVLQTALNARIKEYHPDRLKGLAPEFIHRGEYMARLLSRARTTLLEPKHRAQYDEILGAWTGPVSTTGNPGATIDQYARGALIGKTVPEVEAVFADQRARFEQATGYSPRRLAFLERMLEQAGGEVSADLRREYEAALLQYDLVLAMDEAARAQLFGIETRERGFRASLGYAEQVAGELTAAREAQTARLQALAAGNFGARLALLAGDVADDIPSVPVATFELPAYYDDQLARLQRVAEEREAVLDKRLDNIEPEYLLADLQTVSPDFVVGVIVQGETRWLTMHYDPETHAVDYDEARGRSFASLLEAGDVQAVIEQGFSVFRFDYLGQVDLNALISAAVSKHVAKLEVLSD